MSLIYTHNIVKVVNIVIYLKRLYCCANGHCDEVFHYCTESDKGRKTEEGKYFTSMLQVSEVQYTSGGLMHVCVSVDVVYVKCAE